MVSAVDILSQLYDGSPDRFRFVSVQKRSTEQDGQKYYFYVATFFDGNQRLYSPVATTQSSLIPVEEQVIPLSPIEAKQYLEPFFQKKKPEVYISPDDQIKQVYEVADNWSDLVRLSSGGLGAFTGFFGDVVRPILLKQKDGGGYFAIGQFGYFPYVYLAVADVPSTLGWVDFDFYGWASMEFSSNATPFLTQYKNTVEVTSAQAEVSLNPSDFENIADPLRSIEEFLSENWADIGDVLGQLLIEIGPNLQVKLLGAGLSLFAILWDWLAHDESSVEGSTLLFERLGSGSQFLADLKNKLFSALDELPRISEFLSCICTSLSMNLPVLQNLSALSALQNLSWLEGIRNAMWTDEGSGNPQFKPFVQVKLSADSVARNVDSMKTAISDLKYQLTQAFSYCDYTNSTFYLGRMLNKRLQEIRDLVQGVSEKLNALSDEETGKTIVQAVENIQFTGDLSVDLTNMENILQNIAEALNVELSDGSKRKIAEILLSILNTLTLY